LLRNTGRFGSAFNIDMRALAAYLCPSQTPQQSSVRADLKLSLRALDKYG
jgi:hypothetical protein